jgi:iron-sulfur cluster insertion protein
MSGCGGCASSVESVEQVEVPADAPIVTLTSTAIEKTKHFITEQKKEGWGLRVKVTPGGCAGYQYEMDFEEKSKEGDEVLEQEGLKIFVDKESVGLLRGTKVDFVDELHGSGFKIDNPNASKGCGCGKSFS